MDQGTSFADEMAHPLAHARMGSIHMQMQPPSGTLQAKPAPSRPPAQVPSSTPPADQPFHFNDEQIRGPKCGTFCTSDGLRQPTKQSEEWPQALLNEKSHTHALVTWSKIHNRHMEQPFEIFSFCTQGLRRRSVRYDYLRMGSMTL